MIWPLLVPALLLGSDLPSINPTGSKLTAEEHNLARVSLERMTDGRNRLASGVFSASFRTQFAPRAQPGSETVVTNFCAFDYRASLLRFDRKEEVSWEKSGETAAGSQQSISKYIRTAKDSFLWWSESPLVIGRRAPDASSFDVRPFDARCVGLLHVADFETNTSFARTCKLLSEQELTQVTEEKPGVYRLVWSFGTSERLQRTIWIDRSYGYSPVRLEVRTIATPRLTEVSETTWTRISEVWVPRTFVAENSATGSHKKSVKATFEWESVNQEVPAKHFSPAGFEVPAAELRNAAD